MIKFIVRGGQAAQPCGATFTEAPTGLLATRSQDLQTHCSRSRPSRSPSRSLLSQLMNSDNMKYDSSDNTSRRRRSQRNATGHSSSANRQTPNKSSGRPICPASSPHKPAASLLEPELAAKQRQALASTASQYILESNRPLAVLEEGWQVFTALMQSGVSVRAMSLFTECGAGIAKQIDKTRGAADDWALNRWTKELDIKNGPAANLLASAPALHSQLDGKWLSRVDIEDIVRISELDKTSETTESPRTTLDRQFATMWRNVPFYCGLAPTEIIATRRFLAYGDDDEGHSGQIERNGQSGTSWSGPFSGQLTTLALGSPCRDNMALLSWFIRYYMACYEDERRRVPFNDHETDEPFLKAFADIASQSNGSKSLKDLHEDLLKAWPDDQAVPWHSSVMRAIEKRTQGRESPVRRKEEARGPFRDVFQVTTLALRELEQAFDDRDDTQLGEWNLPIAAVAHVLKKARKPYAPISTFEGMNRLRLRSMDLDRCFDKKRERQQAEPDKIKARPIARIVDVVLQRPGKAADEKMQDEIVEAGTEQTNANDPTFDLTKSIRRDVKAHSDQLAAFVNAILNNPKQAEKTYERYLEWKERSDVRWPRGD